VGDPVSLTYSYDPVLMTANGAYSTSPTDQHIYDSANDSAVNVSVTINSLTYSMTSNSDSLEYVIGYPFSGNTYFEVGAESEAGGSYGGVELGSATIPFTLGQIYDQSFNDSLIASMLPTSFADLGSFTGGQDLLYLVPPTSSGSGAPEPATWISLALGLGIAGLLKREKGTAPFISRGPHRFPQESKPA
jgi:hypothetical protein